jgi:hypothetical protein
LPKRTLILEVELPAIEPECPSAKLRSPAEKRRPQKTSENPSSSDFCYFVQTVQSTIDEIVQQFLSGTKASVVRATEIYKETIFEAEGGYREDFAHCGIVIPNKQLEIDRFNADRFEGFMPRVGVVDVERQIRGRTRGSSLGRRAVSPSASPSARSSSSSGIT